MLYERILRRRAFPINDVLDMENMTEAVPFPQRQQGRSGQTCPLHDNDIC